MIRFATGRLLGGAITIFSVYTLTFLMVIAIPGNPFQQSQHSLPAEVEQALRARYNMDNNWLYFWDFLGDAVTLDFGPSFTYNDWTCNQIIADALPVSMLIGFLAIILAVLIGVPIGVYGAVKRGSWVDSASLGVILLGISIPPFVTGSILLLLFGVTMKVLPIGGWGTVAHLPLPALTLSLPFAAYIARLMRVGMLDDLQNDFIRTAIAKGVSSHLVIWKHAFKVAFLPVLSFLGPACAQAMTGSFVVEKVFGVPGLGQHFVNAALNRDAGLVLSTVLAFSTLLVLFNIAIDLLYTKLDPRISGAAG